MSRVPQVFNRFNSYASPYSYQAKKSLIKIRPSSPESEWENNPVIYSAVSELSKVEFDQEDADYLKEMGINLKFRSGEEAVSFIRNRNIQIQFAQIQSNSIFAQYDYYKNTILLNETYKNTINNAEILALSEAILHECGHAKDMDSSNSIQEEINNLALNTLAHKYYTKKYPYIFKSSNALIVRDGVNIYPELFFDKDPDKKALIHRLKDKYGSLPTHDRNNRITDISRKVKENNN